MLHCDHPGNSVTISPDGKFRICCYGKELSSVKDQTIKEFFNSKEVAEIKNSLDSGVRHKYCNLCWQLEDTGLQSYRQIGLPFKAESDFPAQLDIKFNNICNLACKMCDPVSSSKLATEWKQLGWMGDNVPYNDTNSMTILPNWTSVDYQQNKKYKIFDEILDNISHIKRLKFTGGEPFMTKEILRFLKAIPCNNRKNIILKFTTNGTQVMDDWNETLKSFKECNIGISCDGVAEVYDYIRYPNTWNEWLTSHKQITGNYKYHINCTVTIFNIFNLHRLTKWGMKNKILNKLNLGYDNIPLLYAPINLPKTAKEQAVESLHKAIDISTEYHWTRSLKHIAGHMLKNQINLWDHFVKVTKQQDAHRKQSFVRVVPELTEYFG